MRRTGWLQIHLTDGRSWKWAIDNCECFRGTCNFSQIRLSSGPADNDVCKRGRSVCSTEISNRRSVRCACRSVLLRSVDREIKRVGRVLLNLTRGKLLQFKSKL